MRYGSSCETISEGCIAASCWQFNYNPIVHAILNVDELISIELTASRRQPLSYSLCVEFCRHSSTERDLFFTIFSSVLVAEFSLRFQGCDCQYHYQSYISHQSIQLINKLILHPLNTVGTMHSVYIRYPYTGEAKYISARVFYF